ncbi:MAG: hypothetical protein U0172_02110 [Nitrospiraceae bacterium]
MIARRGREATIVVLWLLVATLLGSSAALASDTDSDCTLPDRHAGLSYSLNELPHDRRCRLLPIVTNYTTANKIGPVVTPVPLRLYRAMADQPPTLAALVNRLELGLHRAEWRDAHRFWLTDGEGTEGTVELLHESIEQGALRRAYAVDGTHDGRFLPSASGSAVVLLWAKSVTLPTGEAATETTLVLYVRAKSRFLSGLLSLVRPLVGRVVIRQVGKAFETVNRLAQLMRQEPARVMAEATDPPSLPDDAVTMLRKEMAAWHRATPSPPQGTDRPSESPKGN